jgi:signal transduction histidine kinase
MNTASPDIEERWARWLVERNQRGLRVSLLIIATVFPTFGVLDWLVAPRTALPWLWTMRALLALAAVTALPLVRRVRSANLADAIGVACALSSATGVSLMTTYLGGLASPYYAGLVVVFVAAGLLVVWRTSVVIIANACVVLIFVIVNLVAGEIGATSVVFSNLAFLSIIAVISGVGQIVQLHTHRDQLVQRVHLEQATAKLERAHAELQQLDEFKTRFFANITHELRTPLAMILTPLELVLQGEMGEFTEPQRSSFTSMHRSALKLLKLINDLLDLSRLEESKLRLQVDEHDLVEHLQGLTEQTQVLAQRKTILLRFHSEPQRAAVWCDLERLERVFVNLLSNALKFTPSGGHVDVSVVETGEAYLVAVEDDGPGFPPDKAEKLFERFYQLDMAGTRQHGGTGIGLALAREIVLLHGGAIEARSEGEGRGSRFTVALRKGTDHFRPEALAGPPQGQESDSTEWGVQLSARREFRLLDIEEAAERRVVERDADEEVRPYTAVVVEDSPQIVKLVHQSLRRQFKVLAAPDGLKGLDMVVRERPSLVVTDLMMPGIDGFTLTQRLRENPQTRHIPVLMLTARGDLDDRVKGLETGVSAYLTKPFSPKELVTCARQLVHAKEETADLVLTQRMESLEIVTAGLAHEINNPLNYVKNALARVRLDAEQVLGLADEKAAQPLSEGERAQLDRIAARLRELLGVADSGLKRIGATVELMTRYGRGGFKRELVLVDAWEAARTVVGVVQPATGRRVEVELDLRGDGTLECVPEELHQVLTNLVQNAIEAAPDSGGSVHVTGAVDGEALVLSVKDNGPGISADLQSRLFTPFFTTKGPGHGMGLGLTITRRVVQSLGGTLQVTSSAGQGADFTMRVPRRQERRKPIPIAAG